MSDWHKETKSEVRISLHFAQDIEQDQIQHNLCSLIPLVLMRHILFNYVESHFFMHPPFSATRATFTMSHCANVPTNGQFLPATPTLSLTPTPPTPPPPPPPPLNVPPSRARRQLAARLALHSQQKADAEAEAEAEAEAGDATTSTIHDSSEPKGTKHLASELDNDEHDDPLALDEDDEADIPFTGSRGEMNFGEPLHASPPTHPRDGNDIDEILVREANAAAGTHETADGSEGKEGKVKHLTSSPGHIRHLDLDDFANSPAADADDGTFDESDEKATGGEGTSGIVGIQ